MVILTINSVVKTCLLSGICNVQCFHFRKGTRHYRRENNSNIIDLATQYKILF